MGQALIGPSAEVGSYCRFFRFMGIDTDDVRCRSGTVNRLTATQASDGCEDNSPHLIMAGNDRPRVLRRLPLLGRFRRDGFSTATQRAGVKWRLSVACAAVAVGGSAMGLRRTRWHAHRGERSGPLGGWAAPPMTILLLVSIGVPMSRGRGRRPGRTDTMLLVSIDFVAPAVAMVRYSRRLCGDPRLCNERVNAAYTLVNLTSRRRPNSGQAHRAQLFGVPVDRFALVDLHSMERIIDTLVEYRSTTRPIW